MTDVTYNQSLAEVIPSLEARLADFRAGSEEHELTDIDSDTAFDLGYETAIFDLKRLTGDDPVETGVIVYFEKDEADDDH